MSENNGVTELYRLFRPKRFSDVVGQDEAIRELRVYEKKNSWPHVFMFVGSSGCGKTTIGYIIGKKLNCGPKDFFEINAAESRGIDMVRDIDQRMGMSAFAGKGRPRIWMIDECARLTVDAQSSLLKILEDPPSHVYFILCTTDPQKLLNTIRTRCTIINLKPLSDEHLKTVLASVAAKAGGEISDELADKIIECSEGSARMALVLLKRVIGMDNEADKLAAIVKPETEKNAYDLAKALLWQKSTWPDISNILQRIKDDDPEGIRKLIMACARKEMLTGKYPGVGSLMVEFFKDPYFSDGDAKLCWNCFQVMKLRAGER